MIRRASHVAIALVVLATAAVASGEDGYDLWLRYRPLDTESQTRYREIVGDIVARGDSATLTAAATELRRGLRGLVGTEPKLVAEPRAGSIVIGTPRSSPAISSLGLPLERLGRDGYLLRSARIAGARVTVIAANEDVGVLYGAFHFLRLLQTLQPIDSLDVTEVPKIRLRVLDHWDNLDRTVERGYAGESIWDWWKLPDYLDPRYVDYARANASLGVNGAVLNNVNAAAEVLTAAYIEKAAALAGVLRPFGIRVYFSANFAAPVEIGGLATADPLDPAVRAWWGAKADEIYRAIPDFGGFLVKANSEGQPGPQQYGRSHADGANALAAAVAPHGGVVMWRAFVYTANPAEDRAAQAYDEFHPLDGKFAPNVLVQVKNGPIDFQPREPFHPLFGAMPKTPLMLELQITKEYLGFATHLAYLGTLFEEVLDADTQAAGGGSTVAKVVDGELHGSQLTGIAGVANVGSDRNWSGSHFDQANWYAFGRLAWDPEASARTIAEDWARMTFSSAPELVAPVVDMMMSSRETVVDYMTPLGLHHLMASGHHYGPGPWVDDLARPDQNPVYFHRADSIGLGFDRTRSGSGAVTRYAPAVAGTFGDPSKVSEQLLLWFHHVPWDRRMSSGRTLWDELVVRYSRGVENVEAMQRQWAALAPYVDAERHAEIGAFLRIQAREARWWRDACIAYFQTFSQRPLPAGFAAPEHPLDWYREQSFSFAPGH
jgi:alpha-glucuronidase